MKKSELRGTGEVFRFTLIQTVKSKAYIISVAILLLLALLTAPVMQLINGGASGGSSDSDGKESSIGKVYICDETMLLTGMDFTSLDDSSFRNVQWIPRTESFDDLCKVLEEEGKESKNVILHFYGNEVKGLTAEICRNGNGDLDGDECRALADSICRKFDEYKLVLSGLSEEELKVLDYKYDVAVNYLQADGTVSEKNVKDDGISQSEWGIVYFVMFFVYMICVIAATNIATAIVTDKSTKVAEFLLTSVRPMALLFGKVLAMLVSSVGQFVLLFLATLMSNKLTALLFDTETTYLSSVIPKNIFANLSPVNFILGVLTLALGMLFYAIVAGICGATVSKMEELQDSLKLFTTIALIGMIFGMVGSFSMQSSATSVLTRVTVLFPLSSALLVPGTMLIGTTSVKMGLIAIVILIVCNALLVKFTATVYESLITHTGNRITFKQLLGIKGKQKGGAKK